MQRKELVSKTPEKKEPKTKGPLQYDPESTIVRNEHAGPKVLGLDNTTLWRRRREDPTFPKPIRLGANSVGFFRTELLAWAESKKRG